MRVSEPFSAPPSPLKRRFRASCRSSDCSSLPVREPPPSPAALTVAAGREFTPSLPMPELLNRSTTSWLALPTRQMPREIAEAQQVASQSPLSSRRRQDSRRASAASIPLASLRRPPSVAFRSRQRARADIRLQLADGTVGPA